MNAEIDRYRSDGYVALDRLFPVEVLHPFYTMMQEDVSAGGRSVSLTIAYADDTPCSLSVGTDRIDTPEDCVTEDFQARPTDRLR